jgi:hypothetical protein
MSARSVTRSKAGTDYIDKYLKTHIHNGNLHIVNSTGDALYHIQGSEIIDSVNVILPILSGDDTIAFQNTNNNFGGVQTFNQGVVTQGGLLVLPDPNGVLEDDVIITDGLNLVLGSSQGTTIGMSPTQMLGFFGVTPTVQPAAGNSASAGTVSPNIFDVWDSLLALGLLSGPLSSGFQDITEVAQPGSNPPTGTIRLYVDSTSHALSVLDSTGVSHNIESPTFPPSVAGGLPSQVGGRWGVFQGAYALSPPVGQGLLTQLSTTPSNSSVSSTFINNRPATNFVSGSSSANYGGFRTTNPICTPLLNPTLTAKIALSTNALSRIYIGLASSTSLTTGFNTVLNSISGFMIGFGSGDTNYSVATNNGGATQTNDTTGFPVLQTAGTATIFKLSWVNATTTLTWSIQTAVGTTTTGTINTGLLPASGTQMYLYCTCQTNTSSSLTLTVEDVEISLGADYAVF